MRVLQIAIVKLLSLLTMLSGGALVAVWFSATVRALIEPYTVLEDSIWLGTRLGAILGGLIFLVGFLGLLPLMKPKRIKSTISFSGSHGEVTIQLDSVEATLARVVSKMPFVKKIWVRVIPSEDNHRAHVSADVWIYKNAESTSAREITNAIMEHLMDTAVNILGVEEITAVDVNVRGIIPAKISSHKAANEEEVPKKSETPKSSAIAATQAGGAPPASDSDDPGEPNEDAPTDQGTDIEGIAVAESESPVARTHSLAE